MYVVLPEDNDFVNANARASIRLVDALITLSVLNPLRLEQKVSPASGAHTAAVSVAHKAKRTIGIHAMNQQPCFLPSSPEGNIANYRLMDGTGVFLQDQSILPQLKLKCVHHLRYFD